MVRKYFVGCVICDSWLSHSLPEIEAWETRTSIELDEKEGLMVKTTIEEPRTCKMNGHSVPPPHLPPKDAICDYISIRSSKH